MSEPWIGLMRLPAEVGTRLQALSARTQISTTVLICRAVVACLPVMERTLKTFPQDDLGKEVAAKWNTDGDVPSDNLTGGPR